MAFKILSLEDAGLAPKTSEVQRVEVQRVTIDLPKAGAYIDEALKAVFGEPKTPVPFRIEKQDDREGQPTTALERDGLYIYPTLCALQRVTIGPRKPEMIIGWAIDEGYQTGGTYWDPPDYDVRDVGLYHTLHDAACAVVLHYVEDALQDFGEEMQFREDEGF